MGGIKIISRIRLAFSLTLFLVLAISIQEIAVAEDKYPAFDKFRVYVNDEFVGERQICCDELIVNVETGDLVEVRVYWDNKGDYPATLTLTPPQYITDHMPQSVQVPAHKSGVEQFYFSITGSYEYARDLEISIMDRIGSGMQLAPDICKFYATQVNSPPKITNFMPNPSTPQRVGSMVRWTASAVDPDGDAIYYRFGLEVDGSFQGMRDWSPQNWWDWTPTKSGTYRAAVLIRDGYHAPSHLYDDYKMAECTVNAGPTATYLYNFDTNLDGWERTGTIAPWQGYTLEEAVKWHSQWGGGYGVIVMDACNNPDYGIDASAGIKNSVKLSENAEMLTINALKEAFDGGIRVVLIDSYDRSILGEEILTAGSRKRLSYDISRWAGKMVTIEIKAFGAGEDRCYFEYIGIDSVEVR